MASVDWLGKILDGLAANLSTITGLRVFETVPSSLPTGPVAVIGLPEEIEYDMTFGGGNADVYLPIRLYLPMVSEQSAQRTLHPYLAPTGAQSINAAVETDPTLGGAASSLHLQKAYKFGVYQIGQGQMLGVEFRVWVVA